MGDDIQFGTESYQSMDSWSAGSESQTTANTSFLNGAACSNGDCENRENPAEEAWVKLVSAIPIADQVQNLKCVAQGTAAPSPDEVQSLVSQIRPEDPNNYALREISYKWLKFNNDFAQNPETAVAPVLRSKLTEMSNGWQGDDFDAFAEQMEVVFANCEQIAADIGTDTTGMAGLLEQKASEIFSLQGAASGELPYPAPQYWVEDKGGLFSNPKVHVRAPFKPGDCEVAEGCMFGDGDAEQAMELGGFDSEYTGELNQYMTDQTEYHYTRLKAEQLQASEAAKPADSTEDVQLTPEQESSIRAEAERLATEDANNRAAQDYEAADQDYQARATEQNETVVARWTDAETSASSFSPTVETSRDTTFRDSAGDLDSAAYSPPGGGNFNTDLSSSGTSGLNSPSNTSTFGSGGNLTGGSNTGTDTSLNPWESSGNDDDETSGGLASGGGLGSGAGTLTGPSLGTSGGGMGAGGGGLGPGSGLFGPAAGGSGSMTGMAGGSGAGRGAGAGGMGKGQGLFGKTAGAGGKGGMGAGGKAGAGGMMGGGRGAGGLGEDEDANTGTWLTEDEDVWGLARFNDENDPLA
ncbi:hypothetical protein O1R50_18065 [Glycomyces luteolus]|uniref:Uncharacterized protein n=1 Tax=Glycomyces luteolus TaxID=2670330 RepID=A0A9X3PBA0_9ACTN|nr:hypothetical protein [Glycomyces luteolus]MDA1361539.1 hypothetical protein [Glycomyces luteolus]